jgi:hypothetical protein
VSCSPDSLQHRKQCQDAYAETTAYCGGGGGCVHSAVRQFCTKHAAEDSLLRYMSMMKVRAHAACMGRVGYWG